MDAHYDAQIGIQTIGGGGGGNPQAAHGGPARQEPQGLEHLRYELGDVLYHC